MYCPTCATQNSDDTKFCRSCGTNLSLVPQAITGQLPEASSKRSQGKHKHGPGDDGPPSLAGGIQKLFMGIGFVLVSAAVFFFAPAGRIWWFWLLLPAFGMLGKGVADIVSVKTSLGHSHGASHTATPPVPHTGELPPRPVSVYDPLAPPSVTEGTTRHLDHTTDSYKERR